MDILLEILMDSDDCRIIRTSLDELVSLPTPPSQDIQIKLLDAIVLQDTLLLHVTEQLKADSNFQFSWNESQLSHCLSECYLLHNIAVKLRKHHIACDYSKVRDTFFPIFLGLGNPSFV